MSLELHQLKPSPKSRKKRKRVGRGNSSGHGTYSTRGLKGQKSRSGGKKGLKLKGLRQMLLNTPKLRGFKSIHPKKNIVNLSQLEVNFAPLDEVTPKLLLKKKIISNIKGGVKILGGGNLTKKLIIEGCEVSSRALSEIKKVGGEIKIS